MPVALVTGAARGIGAATARRLSAAGFDVVVSDRCQDDPNLPYPLGTEAELEAVAEDLGGAAAVADVRSAADLRAAVELASDRFGGLDAAVASAGVLAGGAPIWATDDATWELLWRTNVDGVRNLARAAVPALLERPAPRDGRFVALGSTIALKATPRLAAYAASKAAVLGLVRSLAADLGGSGVTANVVQPGATETALLEASAEVYAPLLAQEFAVHHVDQRLLAPREVAEVVAWLCSPAASAVTGAIVPADAGMTAR